MVSWVTATWQTASKIQSTYTVYKPKRTCATWNFWIFFFTTHQMINKYHEMKQCLVKFPWTDKVGPSWDLLWGGSRKKMSHTHMEYLYIWGSVRILCRPSCPKTLNFDGDDPHIYIYMHIHNVGNCNYTTSLCLDSQKHTWWWQLWRRHQTIPE